MLPVLAEVQQTLFSVSHAILHIYVCPGVIFDVLRSLVSRHERIERVLALISPGRLLRAELIDFIIQLLSIESESRLLRRIKECGVFP